MSDDDGRKPDRGSSPPSPGEVSRRDFLKIGGLAATVPLVGPKLVSAAGEKVPVFGPGKAPITLTVNGKPYQAELEPRTTLLDAQQCGFCTPGFVVATKAFLDRHPNPTPEQSRKGLGGNLCRCGTYVGVRAAALQAAGTGKAESRRSALEEGGRRDG